MSKLILKITLYVLAFVLILIAALTFYLGFTSSGARFIINKVNSSVDQILNIDGQIIDGSLASGLELKDFRLDVFDVVIVSSDYIKLNYSIFDVLTKNALIVNKLETNDLRVHLLSSKAHDDKEEVEQNHEPFKLNFPVNIQIKEAIAHNFAYNSDIVDVYVHSFNARLSAYKNAAFIHEGETSGVYVNLKEQEIEQEQKVDQESNQTKPNLAKLETQIDTQADTLNTASNSNINLRDSLEPLFNVVLPLNVGILNFKIRNVRYQMSAFDSDVCNADISALFNGDKLNVLKLQANNDVLTLDLTGDMIFKDFYKLNFKLDVVGGNSVKAQTVHDGFFYEQVLKLNVTGDLLDLKLSLESLTDNKLNAKIDFRPLDPNLYLKAILTADNFVYPMHTKETMFKLSKMDINLEGNLNSKLDFNILTKFTGYGFDNFAIDAQGVGSFENLDLQKLQVKGKYQGSNVVLNSKAKLNFKDELSLEDELDFKLSDANFINPILKGPLALTTKLSFNLKNNNYLVQVADLKSNFILNGNEAKAYLNDLSIDSNERIKLKLFTLEQRQNHIRIDGDSLSPNGLNANIDVKNLRHIYTGLKGPLLASINFKGNFSDYSLDVKGNSVDIGIMGANINDVVFNANFNSKDFIFNITSFANNVILSDKLLPSKRCIIELNGSLASHKFQSGCGGVNSFFISFKGGLDTQKLLYTGNIIEFFIENQKNGNLSMQKHTSLSYDIKAQSLHVDPMSFSGKLARAKLDKLEYKQGGLQTKFSILDLNIRHLEDLDQSLQALNMQGTVDINLDVDTNTINQKVKASVKGNNIAFRSLVLPIAFDNLALDLNLNNDNLSLISNIDLKHQQGSLNSKFYIDNLSVQKKIRGTLELKDFNLAIFSYMLKDNINSIEGKLNVKTNLAGNLYKPLIYGSIVTQGSLEPRYAIGSVEHFNLNVQPKGNKALLDGVISFNKSDINLNGLLDWSSGANGKLNIKTSQTPVFLAGYGRALSSFDTEVNFLDDYLDIVGNVNIDSASIKVRSIADSYVTTSSDEIIVTDKGLAALDTSPKSSPINTKINLNVDLGNNIKLDAMGLTAKVKGSLLVFKDLDDRTVQGKGRIYLEDGVASLYGHNFIVNRANTNFNGDISNPILDAEVVVDKNDLEDDVTVGVQLSGLATRPDIKFFSKPTMSQNEILSYILYGHGLDNRASTQDVNNANLLLNLGLGSTTSLVNSFVQAIGINGVQFNTQGSGDDTRLSLESNISRKIKISYGYGIFSAVGEFKLRYELVRSLYVEFISSINQAVDVVYSFDFD